MVVWFDVKWRNYGVTAKVTNLIKRAQKNRLFMTDL